MSAASNQWGEGTWIGQGANLRVEWWGRVAYAAGLELQETALAERRDGANIDRLILLEHPPVITCGRSSNDAHVLASAERLAEEGVDVVSVPRGGDVTYHAPGQLVGYFIHDLKRCGEIDLHAHLRALESALIDALSGLGVVGESGAGRTGVFVRSEGERANGVDVPVRKIASIGIGVRHWITYHGFALNVSIDLAGFDRIVPCGLHDVRMTSVAEEQGEVAPLDLDAQARHAVSAAFLAHFG